MTRFGDEEALLVQTGEGGFDLLRGCPDPLRYRDRRGRRRRLGDGGVDRQLDGWCRGPGS